MTGRRGGDEPRRVAGLDGCPNGWVAVELTDGAVSRVEVVGSLRDLVDRGPAYAAIAADIPIGLVDGDREADVAARRRLPGRAASVFAAPPRAVVDGWRRGDVATHAEATTLSRQVGGKGLSQQAWRLVPKIAEVDDLVAGGLAVLEVHPELAFAVAAGEVLPRKRSWGGQRARSSLLARLGAHLPGRFPDDHLAAPDDVLDAAICAWVADGAAQGSGTRTVPTTTGQVAHGRPVVIHTREAVPTAQ
jgi:predicted RNase H-like nuclease